MGFPVRIDEIKKIAKRYNLIVLEDAAQAHGTTYKGKKCGSLADAAIFSFYIAHSIQAGEMGAVVTNNFEIYRLSKKIKASGRFCECPICKRSRGRCPFLSSLKGSEDRDPRFLHDLIGYNFKTTEFQAALALVQLKRVREIINKRQENVKRLNEGLDIFKEILQLPRYDGNISYLAYPVVIKNPQILSRNVLRYELDKRGIETRPLFGCIPTQQPAYAYLKPLYENKLTHAEFIGRNGFYLGAHQYLTDRDLEYVISVFKKVMPRSK
jgi:dTDP-4-amino-4,6-dideoxygalactose transaminase